MEGKKFSSYGVCYLMFYYLMVKGIIPFIVVEEEKPRNPFTKLKSPIKLSETFKGFLEFYERGGKFSQSN